MYQYLSDDQKKKLFNIILGVLILLGVFLAIKSLNALKEGSYIGRGDYPANVVSVNGSGEVYAVPDTGSFSFSVIEEAKTVKEAQDKASIYINRVLDGIKSMGIADRDIKTESYSVYPKYEYAQTQSCTSGYCPPGKQVLIGYEVSQTISVKIRKTSDAGSVLAKAGELGAKNISGLNFIIDDPDSVQAQARDKAIKDAKEKADALAKSLGVRLVRIVNFSENGGQPPVFYAMSREATKANDILTFSDPQVPTGENKVTSNVTITYEVE